MSKAFDFSIPLDHKRTLLLKACTVRAIDRFKANTINSVLLTRLVSILATVYLEEPDKYITKVAQYVDYLMNKLNNSAFPYNEDDYKEVDQFKELREQYNNYLNNLKTTENEGIEHNELGSTSTSSSSTSTT